MKWSELKEKLDIPERALTRILTHYLKYWGLVKKQETSRFGLWSWFEYVKPYETLGDYKIALKHSEELLHGFDGILGEETTLRLQLPHPVAYGEFEKYRTEETILKVFAEEHLKTGYPDIHEKLTEFREALSELQKLKDHQDIKKVFWNGKTYWEDLPENSSRFSTSRFKRPREHIPKPVERLREQRFQSFFQLANNFLSIALKTKMGEPLSGSCRLCPKVHIIKNKQ